MRVMKSHMISRIALTSSSTSGFYPIELRALSASIDGAL
jgi:hypothetical protein